MLAISVLGIMPFIIFNARKLKWLRGHLFSTVVEVLLFLLDVQYYVPLNYVGQLVVYSCLT